eukprot:gb/GECG01016043.1/.p1 GENE.gb/GECG01016043.1/~~gb/GECG01016043.1/.p1  ORF type:complete len:423 (+),score=46.79 gb/GECG01016043.1/:1-1269(+)
MQSLTNRTVMRRALGASSRCMSSFSSGMNEMKMQRYELPQWFPDRRKMKDRPKELAMWDKLQESPIAPPSLTMTDLVTQQSEVNPHKDGYASVYTPVKHDWTFGFLAYASRAVGAGFIDLGFKKGDKFLVWCMNGPEHYLLNLGGPQAGAVQVAVPPEAHVEAIKQVLLDENIRTLFFDQRYGKEYRLDSIQEIFPPVDHESQVNWIMSKRYRHLKQFINVTGEDNLRATLTWRSFPVYDPDPHPVDQIRKFHHEDDVVLIPYRLSGSSSSALERCDPLTFKNLLEAGRAANEAVSLDTEDRVLSTAPTWEKLGIAAGVYGPFEKGAKIVQSNRKFEALEVLDTIDKQRPTCVVMTSRQLEELQTAAKAESKQNVVLSSVKKGLIDTRPTNGKMPSHPFKGADLKAVDTNAMFSESVPLKLA